MTPACAGANLRTSASPGAAIATSLGIGATVLADATVTGSAWSASCPTAKSGSTWYRITAVGGISVASTYGVAYLYAATGVVNALPAPTPLPSAVTFYGRGYGHGVGMSQYGALGRALAGQNAATIIAHYFQGTTLGPVSGSPNVRVMVLDKFAATTAVPLVVYGRGGTWTITGVTGDLPAEARARMIPTTTGSTTAWELVVDSGGTVLADIPASADLQIAPSGAATTIELFSKPSYYDLYRGSLRVLHDARQRRGYHLGRHQPWNQKEHADKR